MTAIYVASKTAHAAVWRDLRAIGHPIISTWIDEAGAGETSDFTDLWHRCIGEAARADVTVLYHEPGEVLKGAFIELGAALASGRRVFVVGDPPGTWPAHPLVTRFPTITAALNAANAPPAAEE